MTDIAIRVEGIGKLYRVGERERYQHLRHVLANAFRRRLNGRRRPKDSIWAVRDVSFEVHQGEVVGLIGRNGAGKSTLLKLLARITRPTVGGAQIHGRIGSLLEVGTGFHHELTGRENIFLSGAILGMKKAEIRRKFDEIVAFAEVERFLDSPLKHYSSGMQMRLAFAVAAHLEPEILLVDEVLAVGDAAFQKKCLGKMQDVSHQGRTIIFVSHNMTAVNALCSRTIMLERGGIKIEGPTSEITASYYAETLGDFDAGGSLADVPRTGTGKARFASISIQPLGPSGEPVEAAYPGCDLKIEFDIECHAAIADSIAAATVYDSNGFRLIDANIAQKGKYLSLAAGDRAKVSLLLREVLLRPGQYFVGLWLGRHHMENTDSIERAAGLRVVEPKDDSEHPIVYPGAYLCRFEENISILQPCR